MIAKPQPLASLKPFPLFAILGLAFPLVAAACASSRPSSVASGRPECVSLSSHSGVIQQVTNMSTAIGISFRGTLMATGTSGLSKIRQALTR